MTQSLSSNSVQRGPKPGWHVRLVWVVIGSAAVLVAALFFPGQDNRKANTRPAVRTPGPEQVLDRGFSSSDSCRECHPQEYQTWHRSFHRTMTQMAAPETVMGNFDDVTLKAFGCEFHLERRGDEFWILMSDPERQGAAAAAGGVVRRPASGPIVAKPVVMTTGSHHMQGYWFPSRRGTELLQLPFYYLLEEQRWVPREDVFLRPREMDLVFANWSMTCIKCHSVAGVPGGYPTSDEGMVSKVAELGIACEACHGPGEEHVRLQRMARDSGIEGDRPPGSAIVSPLKFTSKVQSEICGQCHSEFWPMDPIGFWTDGLKYRAGAEFRKSHHVVRFEDAVYKQFEQKYRHTYWNDGTCRVGGDEFNGLIDSPCYQRGELSCLSCHSLHQSDPNDMLAEQMDGNTACQQCHTHERFNAKLEHHTHHARTSAGSLCYNCHMPHTSYALLTAMRSHRVTSPAAEPVVSNGRPNACNLCHLDKTLVWTGDHLSKWYGLSSSKFSGDESTIAASLLWMLRGDAAQRAIAAWHMGWNPAQTASGDSWQAPMLSELLLDPYSGVRYQAVRAIRSLPGFDDFQCDFIAPDSDRRNAKTGVLDIWRERGIRRPQHPADSILILPNGQPDFDVIKRLLKQRDDTFVKIPE